MASLEDRMSDLAIRRVNREKIVSLLLTAAVHGSGLDWTTPTNQSNILFIHVRAGSREGVAISGILARAAQDSSALDASIVAITAAVSIMIVHLIIINIYF